MKVLKFYADWCGPCKMLSKIIEDLNLDNIQLENINIDEHQPVAIRYNIRSIPTCVIVDDSGNEVKRQVGMMTEAEFKKFVGE